MSELIQPITFHFNSTTLKTKVKNSHFQNGPFHLSLGDNIESISVYENLIELEITDKPALKLFNLHQQLTLNKLSNPPILFDNLKSSLDTAEEWESRYSYILHFVYLPTLELFEERSGVLDYRKWSETRSRIRTDQEREQWLNLLLLARLLHKIELYHHYWTLFKEGTIKCKAEEDFKIQQELEISTKAALASKWYNFFNADTPPSPPKTYIYKRPPFDPNRLAQGYLYPLEPPSLPLDLFLKLQNYEPKEGKTIFTKSG